MSQMGRTESDPGTYFVNFNQDCTSLAVGSKIGYNLFSLVSVDTNVDEIHSSHGEDICLVERLFSSSLVAIVSLNAPRKLKVCHFKKGTEICNYSYSNTILAVRLNRARLVVCLEESLYIHNIRDMKVVHTIRDTPPNSSGLCALAADSDHCYLAYPGSARTGEVQIFDAVNLHAKTMIPAHESPLAAIAFNPTGTEIATASEKGTVIRVFNVHDGSKLFEFRRGMKRCVSIASLSFSTCSKYLCCSSNTETVHIFKLENSTAEGIAGVAGVGGGVAKGGTDGAGGGVAGGATGGTAGVSGGAGTSAPVKDDWMGYFTKTVTSYLPLALPAQVTDVFTQGRAFALAALPVIGLRHTCVITTIQRSLKLLVASQEGFLYVYQVASVEGGDCRLIIRHDLRNVDQPALPAAGADGLPATSADAASNASLDAASSTVAPAASTAALMQTAMMTAHGESMPVAIPTQAVAPMTMATITPDGLVVASGDQRLVTGSVSDIEDDYPGM